MSNLLNMSNNYDLLAHEEPGPIPTNKKPKEIKINERKKNTESNLINDLKPTKRQNNKLTTQKQSKAIEDSRTFTALAKERKFKIYFSKVEEESNKNVSKDYIRHLITYESKDKKSQVKGGKSKHGTLNEVIQVCKLTDFEKSINPAETMLNVSDFSLVRNRNVKSNTFLTSKVQNNLKEGKSFDLNEDSNHIKVNSSLNIQNMDKDLSKLLFKKEDERIYNKLSVVPMLKKGSNNGNEGSATIDHDFFLKHTEKPVDKSQIVNFMSNPKLFKRVKQSHSVGGLGPEYYLKKKQQTMDEYKRRVEESKELYCKKGNSLFDTSVFNKLNTVHQRNANDVKNLVYNSQDRNLDKESLIREMMKSEMLLRANKMKLRKESTLEEVIKNRNILYEGIIQEIKDSKEKFLESLQSPGKLMNSTDSLRATFNISDTLYLDLEEKNVLGVSTNPSVFKRSADDKEGNGITRVYQHPKHYKPAKPKRETNDTYPSSEVSTKLKKSNLNDYLVLSMNDNPLYQPKKEVKDTLLNKKIKFQDRKITSVLNKIYDSDVVLKTLQDGSDLIE